MEGSELVLESMLSTIDNPYDPFDDYNKWYAFDAHMGYHSPSLLARCTVLSDEQSDVDQSLAIENAIEEIVTQNVSGVHVKVQREVPDTGA
jgi:hypothetical protein